MTGAGYDVAMRITKTLCGPADGPDTAVIEFNRIEFSGLLDLHFQTDFLADFGGTGAKPRRHIVDHLLLWMAEIDGEHDLARNDVARIRIDVAMADSTDRKRRMRPGDFIDQLRDPRHAQTGVHALRHRGGAGMRLLAGEGDLKPVQPLPMGDDSDIDILVLEDRPLLDMKLEEGRQLACADLFIADPADPLKLAADDAAKQLAEQRATFQAEMDTIKADAKAEAGRAKVAYQDALESAKKAAAEELKKAVDSNPSVDTEAFELEYAALDEKLKAQVQASDEAYERGKAEAEKALAEARFEYEGKLLAAEAAAATTLEEERARFEAAMAKQRSEADAAARAAEDAAKATIEETRAKAAEELKSVMASADTFRDNLDRQFKNEAKRARDEFDAQIKAYDQKLLDTSRDLTARHEQETKDLLAAHASEMEAKNAQVRWTWLLSATSITN